MYLVHDLYGAAIARWRAAVPSRRLKKAMLECWPRTTIYTNAERTTQAEVFSNVCTIYDVYGGWYDDPDNEAQAKILQIHKGLGQKIDDLKKNDVSSTLFMDYTLKPRFRSAELITYDEVGNYINENSYLMDDALLALMAKAVARADRLQLWMDSAEYPDTPPTYSDDPDFPTNLVEAEESYRLSITPEWNEVNVIYNDKTSASYSGWRSFEAPLPVLTNAEVLDAMSSGYVASFNPDKEPVEDLVEDGYVPTKPPWFSDEYKESTNGNIIRKQLGENMWANGTLAITDDSGSDGMLWAAIIQGGMDSSKVYGNYGAKYTTPDPYDPGQPIIPPSPLYEVEFRVVSNTVKRISHVSSERGEYNGGDGSLVQYTDTYARVARVRVRYKRIANALDLSNKNATSSPAEQDTFSGQAATPVGNSVATTAACAEIMSYLYANDSTLGLLLTDTIIAIQKDAYSALTPLSYELPWVISLKPAPIVRYISVEQFELLDHEEAYRMIIEAIGIHATPIPQDDGKRWYDPLVKILSIIIAVILTVFLGPLGPLAGAAFILLLQAGSYLAAKNGNMALAQLLGDTAVLVGYVVTLLSLGATLSVQTAVVEGGKEVIKRSIMEIIWDFISNLVIKAYDYVVTSITTVIEGFVTSILSAMESLTTVLRVLMKTYSMYREYINPYEEPKTLPDYDNPVTPDTAQDVIDYCGGESFRGIFELPEEMDISYQLLGPEVMCENVGFRFYSR